jgi:hypothetical protein
MSKCQCKSPVHGHSSPCGQETGKDKDRCEACIAKDFATTQPGR